ncbi:MAG: hypothetical protein RBT49_14355 [Bacteroidales bacterium]|jgi:hypothetical protein|nr:hypothetical protein [Bacteroidales bacterium]
MKKLLYFTFGILLFTLACEEDSVTTKINGTVKDYYTENAISNINLRVYDNTIDPTNPQLRQIQPYDSTSFVTKIDVDGFGNFDFETELLKKGKDYLLVFNDSDKFSIYKNEIEVGEKNNFNLKLKHYNTLKVTLENSITEVDSLTLSISVDNSNYDLTGEIVDLLLDENFSLSDNLNVTVFSKSIPDCLHYITCRYFNNGNFIDNVVIEKNVLNVDTTEILIEF